jgi:hypothetical protein
LKQNFTKKFLQKTFGENLCNKIFEKNEKNVTTPWIGHIKFTGDRREPSLRSISDRRPLPTCARSGPRSQKHRGKHRKEKKKHRRNCKKSIYKDVEKIREQKFERKILKEKNSGKHFKNL